MQKITIYKQGNLLRVRNCTGRLAQLITRALTYQRKQVLMTAAQKRAAGGRSLIIEDVCCCEPIVVDGEPQIRASVGFLSRISDLLTKSGYVVSVRDLVPCRRGHVFTPNWDNAADFDWRYRQRDTLETMINHERGQVWWATGAGKSWLMVPLCLVLPKARVVICTKHISVLTEHYTRLSQYLPSVGLVYGSSKRLGHRVMCVSSGSLHHINANDVDILIADEHHELATDKMFEQFARFHFSRMFGLSANYRERNDNADFELEGIFGPLITTLSYQEGVKNDMIVPIEVRWRSVKMGSNPAYGFEGIMRKRLGIWRNRRRNQLIAEDASKFPDEQVLIVVETLEHACYLKQLLPDFTLCYAPADSHKESLETYKSWGLISEEEPLMTSQRLFDMKRRFEAGTLRKVIATSVWNRGVNFHHLQVLIRADSSSSTIADTQIPGRLARLCDGKRTGLLLDYLDEFDPSFKRKAQKRAADYQRKGWIQIVVDQEVRYAQRERIAAR